MTSGGILTAGHLTQGMSGVGDREKIGGGRCPADRLLRPPRHLLAAPREGADDHGQQHLQWCAHGRRLARQAEWASPPR